MHEILLFLCRNKIPCFLFREARKELNKNGIKRKETRAIEEAANTGD